MPKVKKIMYELRNVFPRVDYINVRIFNIFIFYSRFFVKNIFYMVSMFYPVFKINASNVLGKKYFYYYPPFYI